MPFEGMMGPDLEMIQTEILPDPGKGMGNLVATTNRADQLGGRSRGPGIG